ncbi:MAG TPA: DUF6282 family protein [Sphingomonadaceae bacterium]|nr:DUF6282 family protein [Sphingomonadaceae bacterium]
MKRFRNIAILLAASSLPFSLGGEATASPVSQEVRFAPVKMPSVMLATPNVDLDAWQNFKSRNGQPSVDQHLTDPILTGAIDLHAHYGPDTYHRQWDAFEIARLAKERGMRGLVLKSHWTESATLANLIRKYGNVPGLEVFGGLVLNTTVGGINPQAVRFFAEVEGKYAKIVWMPTHDSEHEVKFRKEKRPYVRVSVDGHLLPQVLEVLDLIKHYDLTLATGHVTAKEMLQIVSAAHQRGITRIIITHPNLGPMFTSPSTDEMRQAVAMNAYVEVVSSELRRDQKESFVQLIRTLGPAHIVVATDSGITGTPNHPDALAQSIAFLRSSGFTENELDLMFRKNPARVLGLPDS